ncbi:hypothetical protein ENUP19_0002G0049 [Entamoeba nuttalli]|uniref:VPS9 domain-containing protein n=2 Tax=Entamoeba nuttalli TaxID=412467 RepID=K2GR34_ENTNP|nr:hypothetical protein ENU1_197790 [Entamoeba nuttalli P19]EKE37428.1 hypothetical protein ENU1_197790 [Entamoeba nuttalli P19]|eukprot:XP_008860237.1 hypothetical protein ENU1_197790 [Entamoeba nuttalli P19]
MLSRSSSHFSSQSWRKSTNQLPSSSISPPVEIDIPGEVPFEDVFEKLMESFAKQYCMPYVAIDKIINSKEVNSSLEIKKLLSNKIGLQSVVTCLEHEFTLVIPHRTLTLTPEFLLTHMIKKNPNDNNFVTLNGLYGKITDGTIALYANQKPLNPWKTMPDIFYAFPKHFYDNLESNEILLRRSKEISLIANDSLQSPFGEMPILFIETPLIFDGCSWGWVGDGLQPGFLWMECPSIKPRTFDSISKTEIEINTVEPKWFIPPTEPEEHSGNLFLERLSNQKSLAIRNSFETAFKQFSNISSTLKLNEKAVFLKQLINGARGKIQKHELWKADFKTYEQNIINCIETIFTCSLFESLWPPSYEDNPKEETPIECREKDKKLEDFILMRQFIQVENIGLGFLKKDEQSILKECGALIRNVNMKRSPIEKAKILRDAYCVIENIVKQLIKLSDNEVVTKTLAYILLKENIQFIPTNICFIKLFHMNSTDWIIDIVEKYDRAVLFLLTLGQEKVLLPKEDYNMLFSKAKRKAQNPLSLSDYYSEIPIHFDKNKIIPKLIEMKPEDLTDEDLDILLKEFKIAMKENRELHSKLDDLKKKQQKELN